MSVSFWSIAVFYNLFFELVYCLHDDADGVLFTLHYAIIGKNIFMRRFLIISIGACINVMFWYSLVLTLRTSIKDPFNFSFQRQTRGFSNCRLRRHACSFVRWRSKILYRPAYCNCIYADRPMRLWHAYVGRYNIQTRIDVCTGIEIGKVAKYKKILWRRLKLA